MFLKTSRTFFILSTSFLLAGCPSGDLNWSTVSSPAHLTFVGALATGATVTVNSSMPTVQVKISNPGGGTMTSTSTTVSLSAWTDSACATGSTGGPNNDGTFATGTTQNGVVTFTNQGGASTAGTYYLKATASSGSGISSACSAGLTFAPASPPVTVNGTGGAWKNSSNGSVVLPYSDGGSFSANSCSISASSGGSTSGCSCTGNDNHGSGSSSGSICYATFTPTTNLSGNGVGSLTYQIVDGPYTSNSSTLTLNIYDYYTAAFTSFIQLDIALTVAKNGSNNSSGGYFSASSAIGTSNQDWSGGVVGADGKIYGIPSKSSSILKIDPFNGNAVSTFGTGFTTSALNDWMGGVLAQSGKIYAVPHYGLQTFLEIDTTAMTAINVGSSIGAAGTINFSGGVLSNYNGYIYSIPATSATVQKTLAGSPYTTSSFGALGATASKWSGGVLAGNGKIYGIPSNSTSILVIDPVSDTATTYSCTGATGVTAWNGGVLASNGKIYGIPDTASNVLVIDPSSNTCSTVSLSISPSLDATAGKYAGGALGSDGNIYMAPATNYFASTASPVIVFNPTTNSAWTNGSFTSPSSAKWSGAVNGPNGQIFFIPYMANYVQTISVSTSNKFNYGVIQSPYYNKF